MIFCLCQKSEVRSTPGAVRLRLVVVDFNRPAQRQIDDVEHCPQSRRTATDKITHRLSSLAMLTLCLPCIGQSIISTMDSARERTRPPASHRDRRGCPTASAASQCWHGAEAGNLKHNALDAGYIVHSLRNTSGNMTFQCLAS